jgi:hypothetical protein
MVSLSSVVELIKDRVDTAAANGVRWDTQPVLAAALSHFLELGAELELLGSGCNADLTEDQVDALWTQARHVSDSLASFIPLLATCGSLDDAGEE